MLVLHYTGMQSASAALQRMCDPAAEVSAHYMIDEDGAVHRLVSEDRRAWHAGVSSWAGDTDINDRSIGIELVNPGHEFGYRAFPDPQMAALEALAAEILARHPISSHRVVGHSDVAPLRKQDPGELFDWPRLAARGIGIWPKDVDPTVPDGAGDAEIRSALSAIGYDVPSEKQGFEATITAFQRRFRPHKVDGAVDDEVKSLIFAVLALID